MKKGDVIELSVEKYAFEGRGIARIEKAGGETGDKNIPADKYVVFVDGAYPGDKAEAQIRKVKKSYAEAKAVKIITPSKFRIKAECKYFGTCGGCRQQDMDYDAQAGFKQEQAAEIFEKMGGFTGYEVEDILRSEKIFFYRNKMEFSFTEKRWLTAGEVKSGKDIDNNFALGLHIPGVYDKAIDIDECFLQSDLSNKILNISREFFKSRNIPVYSTKTHEGYLRNLVIKQSHHTADLMVNIVTAYENDELMKEYTDYLIKEAPRVTTVINNINLKKASVATGDYEKIFWGEGFIYDKIGRYKFRISANSFFQTNTLQAEKLYETAAGFAEFAGSETVYDLYSGAGTISIFVSGKVQEVYGFEAAEPAVKDAEENKLLNGISNVHFFTADLYRSFLPIIEENRIPKPEIVILDPPRSGMHQNTVSDVVALSPAKIVYVSCNPATQVRDIKLFTQAGYILKNIRPVDMFPHTYHIENVALLIKSK